MENFHNEILDNSENKENILESSEIKSKEKLENNFLSESEINKIEEKDENQLQVIRNRLKEENFDQIKGKQEVDEDQEVINAKGREISVKYVPKDLIYPAFGYGGGDEVIVRNDLPPRVKKFVKSHELYHCKDDSNFGGWIGREIRANLIPGIKDPLGLLATIKASLSKDRLRFYLDRFKRRH
jgi:hypothetical protein